MEEFFTNSWTIGIGGGIISGLIVFLVTSKIFSRRENKEYLQKIRLANNELLYAIRPLVVEQKLPTIEMVNSILISTSKKYNVQINDLYKKDEIADDLTKEIMDNPFLTSDSKLQYCKLTEEIKELGTVSEQIEKSQDNIVYIEKDKLISKEFFSLTLALMTSLTVAILTLFIAKNDLITEIKTEKFDFVSIVTLLTIIPIVSLSLSKVLELLKTKENLKNIRTKIDDSEIKKDINKD
ncbi:hypothetical protein [Empedobacter brevis]|uniref:hypothetical protein n=1 Tax=Empedobacter brevis TaxID=247 RepID=UPI0023F51C64|nr:hypothetical protein [Empedobacter brevis]